MRPTWSEPFASPSGCASLADASSSRALLAAPQETTTRSAGERLALAVAVDDDAGDRGAAGVRLEPHGLGVRHQRDVRVLERRPHAEHLGVGLRVHQAREAVAGRAAHAVAVRHVGLEQPDAAGRVEGVEPGGLQVVGELLDARLVADRGERVGRRRGRLGRILAARAVDLVELLGERVVGLHLVVGDRPRGRDAVVVAQLAEVLRAQAVQRGAVELRGAARRSSGPAAGTPCRASSYHVSADT